MKAKYVILAVVFFLVLVSCAKPSEPSESENILKIEKTLSTGGYARDLSISNEIVFVAEDQQGFSIFNHVSGTRFCMVDSIEGNHVENVSSIAGSLEEDLLFVYDTQGTNTIHVYDVSDLLNPVYVIFFSGDTANLQNLITIPNSGGGIDLLWSNGFELKHVTYDGTWSTQFFLFPNDINGFDLNDDYIVVAGLQMGFYIIERSSGTIINTVETAGEALDVKIVDNNVILALREEGFVIFDINDPLNPEEIYSKNLSDLIYTVDVEDNYLVLSSHSGGVLLYDIAEISSPEFIGNLDSGDIGYTFKAVLNEGKIFAATRQGIQIISF